MAHWFVFYGSFFVAIATVLYIWRCPREIKVYESEFQMADATAMHLLSHGQLKPYQTMVHTLYASKPAWMKSLPNTPNPPSIQQALTLKEIMAVYVAHHWSYQNLKERGIRITIYLLFATGIALLAIPSVFTFFQVSFLAAKHI